MFEPSPANAREGYYAANTLFGMWVMRHARSASPDATRYAFHLAGDPADKANLSLIRNGRTALPRVRVSSEPGGEAKGKRRGKNRIDFEVPANARVRLHW